MLGSGENRFICINYFLTLHLALFEIISHLVKYNAVSLVVFEGDGFKELGDLAPDVMHSV